MKNYYSLLGVPETADHAAIRKAWKELARKYHPDHNPDNPWAEDKFKDVQEAYRVLGNDRLRAEYDLGGWNFLKGTQSTDHHAVNHYFYAICHQLSVNCFEEVEITFTYSGDGRIFKRPSFEGFHITGSPYVSSRMVIHEERMVKETSLTYIICPLYTGVLKISPATIRIQDKNLQTASFEVIVHEAECYFSQKSKANGSPLKFTVHYEFAEGEEPFRIRELMKNHIILIPRSKAAVFFHGLGSTMKYVCMFYGMFMFNYYFDWNLVSGTLAGSLLGGINCHMMYYFANIKSKFYYAARYPVVQDYLERGYFLGESTGIPLIRGNGLFYLVRLLV